MAEVNGVPGPIRVGIVDDDPLVRAGLALLLSGAPDIRIVAEAGDGTQVEAMLDAHRLDVVLMDIRMPHLDGLAATERLRSRPGAPHVIVLTTFHADEQVLRALRAGASGFLLKDTPPREILDAVRTVAAGDATLSPTVTRQLIDHVAESGAKARGDQAREQLARLTARERDVALALGRGSANARIARELDMSVPTVKAHVSRMLDKLGLDNRVQLALLVHDADLV